MLDMTTIKDIQVKTFQVCGYDYIWKSIFPLLFRGFIFQWGTVGKGFTVCRRVSNKWSCMLVWYCYSWVQPLRPWLFHWAYSQVSPSETHLSNQYQTVQYLTKSFSWQYKQPTLRSLSRSPYTFLEDLGVTISWRRGSVHYPSQKTVFTLHGISPKSSAKTTHQAAEWNN